ncbi:MAG: DUF3179 domain-containing (seleno)protein [Verrucomicrobiota bacterium]
MKAPLLLLLVSALAFSVAPSLEAQLLKPKQASLLNSNRKPFPKRPPIPDGALSTQTVAQLKSLTDSLREQDYAKLREALGTLGKSKDPRIGWVLSDVLRISEHPSLRKAVVSSAETLLGEKIRGRSEWVALTDLLIAWDVPAFDGYLGVKREIYTLIVPAWGRLMSDEGEVDWRLVSWGGVGIDNRPYDQTHQPVNSIPASDNPTVTDAAGGSWLSDDSPVFGVLINGEARAYPRFIMEIREMVNDTLGGRDFAMPYCTLCGAAHVWLTDRVPEGVERPVLRTSGLLIRSNKLMYDVVSGSVFDTFLGHATNGPLYQKEISLPGHPVISTTWGAWKANHPATTVLAQSESLGRRSDLRTTRDAKGPIFPVGDVDSRLTVHKEVLGVVTNEGRAIAFSVDQAKEHLRKGKEVTLDGVTVSLDAGGLSAQLADGTPLVAHESFWFGWSQFRPDTSLWTGGKKS